MKIFLLYFATVASACVAADVGHIEDFQVEDFGVGYIKVMWNFVEGDPTYPLHKYSLTIDSDLTSEFKCTSLSCSKTIEDLDACVEHIFDLKPIFYSPSGPDTDGDIASTSGYTTDDVPGEVNSISMTVDNDVETTLKWNPPSVNAKCVYFYNVCFRLDKETYTFCKQANSTTVTVHDLSACATYHVSVTPVTLSGKNGDVLEEDIKTHDGVPGEPQDVVVGLITPETIQLLWNNPADNFLCLDKFKIGIGETHAKIVKPAMRSSGGYDNEFTFNPLDPCTNYTIDVCSANVAEITSDKVIRYAGTDETEPLAPPTVSVTPSGPNTIEVNWGDNENDRCSGSFEVCWNDGVHPIEQCQSVGGDGDNSLIIHDLKPCSNYDISVTVQSPNGTFFSNATTNSTSTADVRPGPVVDLKVIDISTNQLTIQCHPPDVDPQCVKEIIARVINEDVRAVRVEKESELLEYTISGLNACTDYRVLVSTKSASGLESEVREVKSKTLDDVPSEPQMLEVTGVTTTSISLNWFQPATNPRCASKYNLTWDDGVYTDTMILDDSSTFKVVYTVDGLLPCTDYNFNLYAESSAGAGPKTSITNSTAC